MKCRRHFLVPFINRWISALGKKNLEKFLIVTIIFISILPTLYPGFSNNTYAYIFWMIILFCIGRYMGEYHLQLPWKSIFVIAIGLLMICTFVIEPRVGMYGENYAIGMQYSFPLLVASVSLLGIFINLKMPYNKTINWLAKSTFAVYILHDDPDVRAYIWKNLFHNSDFGLENNLWLHFLCTIACIYFICIFIDKIYRRTFYKLMVKIPTNRVESIIDKLCELD